MRNLVLVGRIVFGGLMAFSGIGNLVDIKLMAQLTGAKGMPLPTFSVAFASIILILGGLSILANYRIKTGVLLVWIFLVPAESRLYI